MTTRYPNQGFVKVKNDKWIKIDFTKLVYIKASTNYSIMYFEDKSTVFCEMPLLKLQFKLPLYFQRLHNAAIININYISSINFKTKDIQLNNDTLLKIGGTYKDNLKKYLIYFESKA